MPIFMSKNDDFDLRCVQQLKTLNCPDHNQ